MGKNIQRITRPPEPTTHDPYIQVSWIFYQVEKENSEPYAATFRYAKNKYIDFLRETQAGYSELEADARFYLHRHWEADALIRFNRWLDSRLSSNTRYGIYKTVRLVMDFAYAQRVIDTMVYHAPMHKGARETDSRTAYSDDEQEVINAALAKWISLAVTIVRGYEPEGKGIPYRKKNTLVSLEIDGRRYEPGDAANRFGIQREVIQNRIATGWTSREAVGLDPRHSKSGSPMTLVIEGVVYPSLSAAAQFYGVPHESISHRLRKGYSPEQAVGLLPITVDQSDERALLWSFENEYHCDARAMVQDFNRRKLVNVATEKRLRAIFSRWGVWPFVDDRLVMPLATELVMLTGLNVESLKSLNIDSYQAEHGLTGGPVIVYTKKRSASRTRSEEQTLHLDMLEIEEHFVSEKVADKVRNLVKLILSITSSIRSDAPIELVSRLFIFEDVELSRRSSRKVIVGIDPKRKSGHWYQRFSREEGLLENFGPDFTFNMSRCRPTFVTNMVLSGAGLFQVQAAVGHSEIGTTATYLDGHRLQPVFNATMTDALKKITRRSVEHQEARKPQPEQAKKSSVHDPEAFHESLSGCGCVDPYSPSDLVRRVTNYKEGAPCKYWNMCIFCDNAIVTESSLPKLIVYCGRVSAALGNVCKSPARMWLSGAEAVARI